MRKSKTIAITEEAQVINQIVEALMYSSPILNKDIGKAEPPARYRIDGYPAYADGVNWKPNGTGGKGLWRYDTDTSLWVQIG